MGVQTLPATASIEKILTVMERDGALVLSDVISQDVVKQMVDEVMPYIDKTAMGKDDFTGRHTQRTGALVARTPTVHDLILNSTVLDAAKAFLAPFTEKIILHLTQTIRIHPGNPAQPLHRDRLAWGTHIPLSIEPQFNTIWALTDFTNENGATRCVPGSQKWDWERRAEPEGVVQAAMKAGSVFLYSGTVLHGGGENRSDHPRLGLNLTYTLGWLRQEENQYLSCPPQIAKDLPEELQELLGYTQGNYALGYYSDPEAPHEKSDILPPETILGRSPNPGASFTSTVEDGQLDFSQTEQI
jgi:ectoine hydroxylase-related dioxygenase (phytanoyl-CoA dioxygenase family)